jgi:predicted regulator of Ras-like GTPase activity (Roadblock/LC7/MglB family)
VRDVFTATVRDLTRIPGVQGALVVDIDAGVPVTSDLSQGIAETGLAALTSSLYRRAADASRAAGRGELHALHLEAGQGHLIAVGAGSLLVVVLAAPSAQLGLVRVQAARAAREIES